MDILLKTALFSAEKHKFQHRKDSISTPYINHPIGVANIISNRCNINNIKILQAALLHDTLEDTKTTYNELVENFGKDVADFVKEVTDDKTLPKYQRKLDQIKHVDTMSYESKIVKLADKYYNLSDLLIDIPKNWTHKRVQGYFVWCYIIIQKMMDICPDNLKSDFTKLFNSEFTYNGNKYKVIPDGDMNDLLNEYIEEMKYTVN